MICASLDGASGSKTRILGNKVYLHFPEQAAQCATYHAG